MKALILPVLLGFGVIVCVVQMVKVLTLFAKVLKKLPELEK